MSNENPWASPGFRPERPGPQPGTTPPSPPPAGPPAPPVPSAAPGPPPAPGTPPAAPGSPATSAIPPADPNGWYAQPHFAPGWQAPPTQTPPRTGPGGRKIALWSIGAVVAIVVTVAAVAAIRFHLQTTPLGEVTRAQSVHSQQVSVGTCLAGLPAEGSISSVRVVPCSEPHGAEATSMYPFSDATWPGREQVVSRAQDACELTSAQVDLGLDRTVWVPTEAAWNQGHQWSVCFAYVPNGAMVGSFTAGDSVVMDGNVSGD